MKNNLKVRESSIELLRIISMLMIILSHYCYHGGIQVDLLPVSFNKIILQLGYLGNLGVNIFFLISSYFMYEKEFNIKKLFKLLFEIFSYSIIIYIIFILLGKESFSLINFIKNFFPVLFKTYWFASVYIIIYILTPYLNVLISNLSKKEHLKIICIFLIIWSVLYTFLHIDLYSNYFTDVLILFFIATYIKKYNKEINRNLKKVKVLTITSILGLIIITILFNYSSLLSKYISYFYARNSFFIIAISVGVFILFLNKKYYSKMVNIISSCTFGVYLLHDNYLIRSVLWNFIENKKYQLSPYLLLHMIASVLIIFSGCIVIELIRKNTFQKFANKFIDCFFEKFKWDKFKNRILKIISKKST